jgi:chorismate mutase/prephenate dehydratase
MSELDKLRQSINEIDTQILGLLARRKAVSRDVMSVKIKGSGSVRDLIRERELLKLRIEYGYSLGLDVQLVSTVFREIIDDSVRAQHDVLVSTQQPFLTSSSLVGYHGQKGSYCQLAFWQYCSGKLARPRMIGFSDMRQLFIAVREEQIDAAIVPIESVVRGTIQEIMEDLLSSHLFVVAEEVYKINHCLLSSMDIEKGQISEVFCSYLSFLDCRDFLTGLNVKITLVSDSSLAAQSLSQLQDPRIVAVASEAAADEYGLKVIDHDISIHRNNYVKYFIIAREPHKYDLRIPCKTSLLFATSNQSGSLVNALKVFSDNDIHLIKLDCHPVIDNPWKEQFYVEFEGNIEDPSVAETVKELEYHTHFVRFLGSYPSIATK